MLFRSLDAARAAGAAHTVDLSQSGTMEAAQKIAQLSGGGVYGMLDFVGASATAQLAMPALRKGGRYVIVGLFGGEVTWSLPMFFFKVATVMGSAIGTSDDLQELLTLVRTGKVRPPPLELRGFDQAEKSLTDLAGGRYLGRVVLDMENVAPD